MAQRNKRTDRPIQTISEFAAHMGLSYCTVSRAINGHPRVKETTRQRILQGMDETGFRPNPLARGLRGRGMGLIGVSYVGLKIPIIGSKLFFLQEHLRKNHLRGLLEIADNDPRSEIRIIEDFLRIRVEGIVLIYSGLSAPDVEAMQAKIPFVYVDCRDPKMVPAIALDRPRAMQLLLEHLVEFGHRRFALLGITRRDLWRWPPLSVTARRHGLDPEKCFLEVPRENDESTIAHGRRLMARALAAEGKQRPTAVIALDDTLAFGAIQHLLQEGYRVPQDFSVTGFDNSEMGQECHPTLTTIEQKPEELMRIAGELLLEEIAMPSVQRGRHVVQTVEPKFIQGESTGPVKRLVGGR